MSRNNTDNSPGRSALAELTTLAAEYELRDTARFLATLPQATDRGVTLLAASGVDTEQLVRWIAGIDATVPVSGHPLAALDGDQTLSLTANRVIVALPCGDVLTHATVAAASSVLARPRGTFVIALCGVEKLADAEELNLARRSLWRVLLGDPDVSWRGQDLAERGCLLWSADKPNADIADVVAADMRRLGEWVAAGPRTDDNLDRIRGQWAIDLARHEVPKQSSAIPGDVADPAAQRAAIRDLADRLHHRLDSDLATLSQQINVTLSTLEQDVLSRAPDRLAAAHGPQAGPALSEWLRKYLTDAVESWGARADGVIDARMRRTLDETATLLDDIDWAAVNKALGRSGDAAYPRPILDRIRLAAPTATRTVTMFGPPPPADDTVSVLSFVSAIPLIGTIIAVWLSFREMFADNSTSGPRGRNAATSYLRASLAETMGAFSATVREQIEAATPALLRAVYEEFGALDTALAAVTAPGQPGSANPPADPVLSAELTRLRTELNPASA